MRKVSVIVPVYNEELYLRQCLDSLCNQSLRDIEIICVDDGSNDSSVDIMKAYSLQDSRIKVVCQKNQYAGMARNKGMEYASGKYYAFLDADDFFEETFLEQMYEAAEQNASDIVICRIHYFDDIHQTKIPREIFEELQYLPQNKNHFNRTDIPDYLFQISNGWAWDKLFRADFIKQNKLLFQSGRTANDGYFVYMALAKANVITKLDKFLVNQRINNTQSLSNTRETSWYCGFQMLYDIAKNLKQNELYTLLERSFLNFCLKYVAWSFEEMKQWSVKEDIYNIIRTELVQNLEMGKFSSDFFYIQEQYHKFDYICHHSFGQYTEKIIFEKEHQIATLRHQLGTIKQREKRKIWMFPFDLITNGSHIVLYGAGQVGQDYYKQITDSGYCKVVLWMDKQFANNQLNKAPCGWIEDLKCCQYDCIVIALNNQMLIEEVCTFLIGQNVPKEKIVFGLLGRI